MEDVVVPNSLSIAAAELLLGLIESAIDIAELIEGVIVANSSLTPYSNIIYNSYANHFLTSPP